MGRVLVITGGIGSGKSLVSSILARQGVPVYDCDSCVKALYRTHPDLAALVTADIFKNSAALQKLENALFPVLKDDFLKWQDEHKDSDLVGFESATILDKEYFDGFGDYVVWVDAPKDLRLKRALGRGTLSEESILRRMSLQKDHSSNPRVTALLHNEYSVQQLELQIIELINNIKLKDNGKN